MALTAVAARRAVPVVPIEACENAASDLITIDELGSRMRLSVKTLKQLARDEGCPLFRVTPNGLALGFWSEIRAWICTVRRPLSSEKIVP